MYIYIYIYIYILCTSRLHKLHYPNMEAPSALNFS